MKKLLILIISLVFIYGSEFKFYQKFINNNGILINEEGVNIQSFKNLKMSKNGKIYINFHTLHADYTNIKNGYFCVNYLKFKESDRGKIETNKYICFRAYLSTEQKNTINKYEDYDNYDFIFEIEPINNRLNISQDKVNKFCFDTKHPDLFFNNGNVYCYNGYCYPLENFLTSLENNFPQNKNLILNLPNIECDLDIYYYSDNYLNKILIINNQTHKIKKIIDLY